MFCLLREYFCHFLVYFCVSLQCEFCLSKFTELHYYESNCCCQEMSRILNHPRVYSFLHVPVQSGSDSVLMDMKREYCQADFRHVVDFLRQRFSLLEAILVQFMPCPVSVNLSVCHNLMFCQPWSYQARSPNTCGQEKYMTYHILLGILENGASCQC